MIAYFNTFFSYTLACSGPLCVTVKLLLVVGVEVCVILCVCDMKCINTRLEDLLFRWVPVERSLRKINGTVFCAPQGADCGRLTFPTVGFLLVNSILLLCRGVYSVWLNAVIRQQPLSNEPWLWRILVAIVIVAVDMIDLEEHHLCCLWRQRHWNTTTSIIPQWMFQQQCYQPNINDHRASFWVLRVRKTV